MKRRIKYMYFGLGASHIILAVYSNASHKYFSLFQEVLIFIGIGFILCGFHMDKIKEK